jgi:hypothetical protein
MQARAVLLLVLAATGGARALVPQPPDVLQRKRDLISSVATLRKTPTPEGRRAVLRSIAELEECRCSDAPPDGRWALIFSTQENEPDPNRPGSNFLQPLIDRTYAAFFKVAPALAGAQDGSSQATGASNEQWVSLDSGLVENRVRIPLPVALPFSTGSSVLEIRVDGTVATGVTLGETDTPQLDVTFTECSFAVSERVAGRGSDRDRTGSDNRAPGALRIPLPRPVGTLRTTHCDSDLRVSRGGRGGVFVLKRLS